MRSNAAVDFCTARFLSVVVIVFVGILAGAHLEAQVPTAILNPERGIYHFRPLAAGVEFDSVRAQGASLVYSEIALKDFRAGPISPGRLKDIDEAFERVRKGGIKAIPRITYSDGENEPDAPLGIIERHLAQLQPLLDANRDQIFAFQAGCIGPWGEWHSSRHHPDTAEARAKVLNLLVRHLPSSVQIHIRRPQFKSEYMKGVPGSSTLLDSRIGHHNDCLLASETDAGTYLPDQIEKWKSFVFEDSARVAVGGETCRVNHPATQCPNMLKELERLGFTYLNAVYHPEIIAELKTGGCWDTISERLGYRFEVEAGTFHRENKVVRGQITIVNKGWAPAYSERPVVLRIRDGSKVIGETTLVGVDPRSWKPGTSTVIPVSIPLSSELTKGCEVRLSLPDPSPRLREDARYAIRFANSIRWDEQHAEDIVATLP